MRSTAAAFKRLDISIRPARPRTGWFAKRPPKTGGGDIDSRCPALKTETLLVKKIQPLPTRSTHLPVEPTQRLRSRRLRRTTIIVAAVTVVAFTAAAVFVAVVYSRVVGNVSANVVDRPVSSSESSPDALAIPDWDGAVNILIMGSDTRVGQNTGDYGANETGARSDVMMVLHVSADRENATLVSIPRDTMLPIPECVTEDGSIVAAKSAAQVNGVLGYGPYCSLDTIRALTGLDIDHFIVVDFDGVVGITEAVGGVDVCVSSDVVDPLSELSLTAGKHTIEGKEALAFLRTRHGFGDGSDLGRIAAQQTFLASMARKMKSAGTLTNPVALFKMADAASASMTVDAALASSPANLVGLAGTLANVDLEKMILLQLPVEDYPADRNRVQPIASQTRQVFDSLRNDIPLVFELTEPEVEPTGAPSASETPGVESGDVSVLPGGVTGQTAVQASCVQ